MPFLLQADFAVRRVVRGYRATIEVHWHGLVWADKTTIDALKAKFPANKLGAEGMKAKKVYDLAGALTYTTKDPRLGYITVQDRRVEIDPSARKGWFHRRDHLETRHRRMLVIMTGNLTKPELCSASGEGRAVLQQARQIAKRQGYRRPSLLMVGSVGTGSWALEPLQNRLPASVKSLPCDPRRHRACSPSGTPANVHRYWSGEPKLPSEEPNPNPVK